MTWLDYFYERPYSTLLILSINICVVLLSSLIFRRIVDVNRLEAQEFEVRSYDRSLREAQNKNDKAILRKLKRADARIKSLKASTSKQRLKASAFTILPFITASFLLNFLYSGRGVVLFPFELEFFSDASSFSIWYFLTYLVAYLPLSRIFRTAPKFLLSA